MDMNASIVRVLLLALLTVVAVTGQTTPTPGTKIPPSMLRMSSPLQAPPSEIKFYGVDLAGNAFFVKLGTGLTIRFTGNEAFIDAVTPPPPPPAPTCKKLSIRQLQPDIAGNYVIGADAAIVRNGSIMLLNLDYIHNGAGALPREPWTGDTVLAVTIVDCAPATAGNVVPCLSWYGVQSSAPPGTAFRTFVDCAPFSASEWVGVAAWTAPTAENKARFLPAVVRNQPQH